MTQVFVTVLAATVLASGTATRYDPGVMDVTVANRVRWRDIDLDVPHRGYVALLDCEHIGRLVWLQQGERVGGPYLVADCVAGQDRRRLAQAGWAVDLSWELALEWGVVHDVGEGFVVWGADPRAVPAGPVPR